MPNQTFNLAGKRIEDTYTQVLEGDNSGNMYMGQGNTFTVATASYSLTSSITSVTIVTQSVATSSLFASSSLSASWASSSLSASFSKNAISSSYTTYLSGSATASLFGTASWSNNSNTASYITSSNIIGVIIKSTSSSFASSSANSLSASVLNDYTNNIISADGQNRLLNYITNNISLDWQNSTLYDSDNNPSIYYSNRNLMDTTGFIKSVDYGNRALFDENVNISVDWQNRSLQDIYGVSSTDYGNRYLIDTNNSTSVDWQNRYIYDTSGVVFSVDYGNRINYDLMFNNSIDWQNRLLYNNGGNITVNYNTGTLYTNNGVISVDWQNKFLYDNINVISIEYQNRNLSDVNGNVAVDWHFRNLYDSNGNTPIQWNNRYLYTSQSFLSVDWNNGLLYSNDIISLDYTNRVLSGSWKNSGSVIFTGSLFGTSSWANTASFAMNAMNVTASLINGSTYQITSSWATSSISSSYISSSNVMGVVASASVLVDTTHNLISANGNNRKLIQINGTSSVDWQNQLLYDANPIPLVSVNWGFHELLNQWTTDGLTGSLFGTSSWANNSRTASYISSSNIFGAVTSASVLVDTTHNLISANGISRSLNDSDTSSSIDWQNRYLKTSRGGATGTSADWENRLFYKGGNFIVSIAELITLDWQNQVLSGSWSNSGSVEFTGSLYGTSSWAMNVVNSGNSNTVVTQSFVDIPIQDMAFPVTNAFTAQSFKSVIFSNGFNYPPSSTALGYIYGYLSFPNYNTNPPAFGGLTASIAFHQMKSPLNYKNGLTHSFQYFAGGTNSGEVPGPNNYVYWQVNLFALTSSVASNSNFFSSPVLVYSGSVTKSFSGAVGQSGSMETVTSSFNDPNGYITTSSLLFLTIIRLNTDITEYTNFGANPSGNSTDYTGSVNLVSSRYSWNSM